MEKPRIGVFIGRLQPLHNAHLAVIQLALSEVDHLIIVLGSSCQAKTVKNPWTTEERENMIRACLPCALNDRVSIVAAKDYLYNDNLWLTALQSSLSTVTVRRDEGDVFVTRDYDLDDCNVILYGHDKDRSTFYLHLFPKWSFREVGNLGDIDATRVREFFFRKDTLDLKRFLPEPVFERLKSEIGTPEYERLYDEFRHISDYKAMWRNSPFPPVFVTTDAVVIKSGHILVVRRRGYPGKGLLALPGGFLRQNEQVLDGCVRELKEETQIKLPKDELRKRIVDKNVFDHPARSLRGRTITHAFCFDLGAGTLPKVKGDDDAEKAFWMPLRDVMRQEEEFFEDHFHIINYFVNKF
jgi:bifunctional NMN adenylyltransferase/nudix hydrolase